VNDPAPRFNLQDLEGNRIGLETLMEPGNPVLLLFSEPDCAACEHALPDIVQWQREYADRLLIVLISRGDVSANRAKSDKYNLRNVLLQEDREVARAYLVEATPSAVLVKNGSIESLLAVGLDAIRGVVAQATLPPPVNQGDRVPSLRLPDLAGKMVDLAQLESRILMLFWNTSCGFCQRVLEDLKRWERNPPPDAPKLIIISSSSLEDSRKPGFRSRVLLDPNSAASQVFNSGGTPSAILIEDGRVASGVAAGAQAVLALVGTTPVERAQPV
jgi:peroxiredoxin